MTILNPGWTFFMDKIFSFLFFFSVERKNEKQGSAGGTTPPEDCCTPALSGS